MSAKAIAVQLLQPAAWLWRRLAPLGRLWHHARLLERLTDCEHGPEHGGQALHPSVVVLGMPEVHGSANIQLGRRLYLYPGLYLETQGAGRIEIGDEVVMSRGVHLVAFDQIRIGAGSMIGEYTSIRDANHRTDRHQSSTVVTDASETGSGQALRWAGHRSAPITIGRHVWIGRGVTVLAGVRIGDGAVIGANAVVTRDIPAGAVAVGVPARVLPGGDGPAVVSGDAGAAASLPPPA